MASPVKWANIYTREAPEPKSGGPSRVLPPDVRRAQAKKSSEGGRCRCHDCKEHFTVTYCKVIQVKIFEQDWVCADCRAARRSQGKTWN